ncbi:hypothetical protein EJ05DRAFT_486940 [Pseudovirgaria hyperparasitica]|uniref:Uncharacterized protein n=1 Tax=Pseudovirgaria hyperparasitica TaxID=470096 RepID=A0A6A6W4S9_9PEZI|nr:uncharacterized protein EJ05DRAFT_486940 [Pseudovirgaria hyperparasitica]KAF2756930.1 hypothetical protein EJ05DRAFT_486940 [Pseudovirgaria hyperparasitica]
MANRDTHIQHIKETVTREFNWHIAAINSIVSNIGAVITTNIDNLSMNIVVPSEAYPRLPPEHAEKENVEDTKMEDDAAISKIGTAITTDIDNLPTNVVVPSEAYPRLPPEHAEKENVEDTKMEDDAANTNIRVVLKTGAAIITNIDNSPTNAVVPLDTGETYLRLLEIKRTLSDNIISTGRHMKTRNYSGSNIRR